MTDIIDVAQQRQQDEIDHALAARRPAAQGRDTCRACNGSISPLRRDLGAQLCFDCQCELEHMHRTVGFGP